MAVLSEEARRTITDDYVKRYPTRRAALLPSLWLAQTEAGWLGGDVVEEIAELLDMHPSEVAGIASFYSMFNRRPVGKHLIEVCDNVSCLVNGAEKVLDHLCARLDVRPGGTTADGRFTVRTTECIASCDGAPAIQVNYRYHERMTPDKVDRLLEELTRF